ncbi:serine/threonine protein kinase [Paenibacillus hodogayensis]|uniref:Serine/threonine protein kinase n=1 Tax=Paenibacillus hodogayensis TaxID=279208 RepID=A0ABV5W5S0_9BACL
MTTSSKAVLTEGFSVCGKWNKRRYRIDRLLGEGANGKVFLVQSGGQSYALKFGFDAIDLQMEVNIVRELDKKSPHPFLHDADDVEIGGTVYPFYVMRYIRGHIPRRYMAKNGPEWLYMIGLNVLRKLHALHRQGYVFGDLKTENVLVSGYGEVELVDYGGVTEKGRSVKQFTELYDRGFWNAGERVADDGYDLFGFAVFCLQLAGMEKKLEALSRSLPQSRTVDDLCKLVEESPLCRPVAPILKKALLGRLADAKEGAEQWKRAIEAGGVVPSPRKGDIGLWIKAAFIASIGLFVSVVWTMWQNG